MWEFKRTEPGSMAEEREGFITMVADCYTITQQIEKVIMIDLTIINNKILYAVK